jgi:hypothetical protein
MQLELCALENNAMFYKHFIFNIKSHLDFHMCKLQYNTKDKYIL